MPERPRPQKTKGSEHWLRVLVNEKPDLISKEIASEFGWQKKTDLKWVSPIKKDGYAEYYDQSFLDLLEIKNLKVPLNKFWPARGPRWDGLARTDDGKIVLVEAKAHISECVDYKSKASPKSYSLIKRSLDDAKRAFKANPDANWEEPFYQHANRLAHLYYLHTLNKKDAYMVFINFANADDISEPATRAQWEGAVKLTNKCLGLGKSALSKRVADIIIDVEQLRNRDSSACSRNVKKTQNLDIPTFVRKGIKLDG
ncbi:hypothetical protein ACFLS1_04710 [Verrucomicrobiota bacterium]